MRSQCCIKGLRPEKGERKRVKGLGGIWGRMRRRETRAELNKEVLANHVRRAAALAGFYVYLNDCP